MSKDDRSVLSWLGFGAAIAALIVAIFAITDDGGGGTESAAPGGESSSKPYITITLKEFSITPADIVIPTAGATLHLVNEGSVAHNYMIKELDLISPDLPAGTMYDWEIGPLAEGDYNVLCNIAGHEAAGMKGTLIVSDSQTPTTDEGGASGGESSGGDSGLSNHSTTWDQMDATMLAQAQRFPAKTSAHGGQPMPFTTVTEEALTPTFAGETHTWKVFEITAKVVDWEVEPGKIVKAWTYNGVVPGPEIQVYTGDWVRVVFKNELPDSTSLHFHGIEVPNVMDGVDPYTEAPTIPGGTHIYEFPAMNRSVGIYHSHHNAEQQIPDGMFGSFLIDSFEVPQKLIDKGYPAEVTKQVTMVLNDAGVIGLSLNGKSFPATTPYTLRVGEVMIVHYQNEGLTMHPMHLHQPMGWVIAKDGHLLEDPYPSDTINVAPGERFTVAYMGLEPGVWAWHCHILTHAETPEGMKYMVTALIVMRGSLSEEFRAQNPSYADRD